MAAKIGGGPLHSVPPGPKIWGGTCLWNHRLWFRSQ